MSNPWQILQRLFFGVLFRLFFLCRTLTARRLFGLGTSELLVVVASERWKLRFGRIQKLHLWRAEIGWNTEMYRNSYWKNLQPILLRSWAPQSFSLGQMPWKASPRKLERLAWMVSEICTNIIYVQKYATAYTPVYVYIQAFVIIFGSL